MFPARRSFPIVPLPVDGGTSDYKVTRGMIQAGIVITGNYSVNVTTAGAAVRTYAMPIRRVILKDGAGVAIHTWRARDLVALTQIVEQQPIGSQITPPSGFAIANYANLAFYVTLMFEQFKSDVGDMTALPTFADQYQDMLLTIEWGSVTDILTGTPVGPVTFTSAFATQLDYADAIIPDRRKLIQTMPVSFTQYKEYQQAAAVAAQDLDIELDRSANYRAMMIVTEDANGEPTNGLIDKVTLYEDNSLGVYNKVPWATLRSNNGRHFGLTMPTGYAILDFGEDGHIGINEIYRATQKNKVTVRLDTLALIGTVRVVGLQIKPPIRLG